MESSNLTCQQLVELVTDYLEGALPPTDSERFERHLDTCSNCRAYLDQMRRTISLVGRISDDSLAPEVRDELLYAFQGWNQKD